MRHRTIALVSATVVTLAGCSGGAGTSAPDPTVAPSDGEVTDGADRSVPDTATTAEPPAPTPAEPPDGGATADAPADVEVTRTEVATGLAAPWDVAWLGDRTFVTERDSGRLMELDDAGTATEVRTFDVDAAGEGGLLGLVAEPAGDRLYAYLTTGAGNRVVRFDPDADDAPEVILDGIPADTTHDGGRLAFGPDGTLFVATGDAQDRPAAQDPGSMAGKILRITPDGGIPEDNPTDGSPVWSLGHRNVQGLAFDGAGRLFAPEFGPDRDDEVNLVEAGANHGWPEVTGQAGVEGFTDPVLVRQPPEASWSGGVVLTDGAIPQWEGDLFVAALRGERLYRIPLEDGQITGEPEELYVGEFGRLRDVTQAPDGSLWLLTNNRDGRGAPRDGDDRIIRLGPPLG